MGRSHLLVGCAIWPQACLFRGCRPPPPGREVEYTKFCVLLAWFSRVPSRSFKNSPRQSQNLSHQPRRLFFASLKHERGLLRAAVAIMATAVDAVRLHYLLLPRRPCSPTIAVDVEQHTLLAAKVGLHLVICNPRYRLLTPAAWGIVRQCSVRLWIPVSHKRRNEFVRLPRESPAAVS